MEENHSNNSVYLREKWKEREKKGLRGSPNAFVEMKMKMTKSIYFKQSVRLQIS